MPRLAMLARGLRRQPRALILLVPPHPVATAARPVAVLLALQVAVDPVAADPDRAAVREHLDVAVHLDRIDPHGAALFELDVAADPRIGHRDFACAFGLDVAFDAHAACLQGGAAADLYVAVDAGAVERAPLARWHAQIAVDGGAAHAAVAVDLVGEGRGGEQRAAQQEAGEGKRLGHGPVLSGWAPLSRSAKDRWSGAGVGPEWGWNADGMGQRCARF